MNTCVYPDYPVRRLPSCVLNYKYSPKLNAHRVIDPKPYTQPWLAPTIQKPYDPWRPFQNPRFPPSYQ